MKSDLLGGFTAGRVNSITGESIIDFREIRPIGKPMSSYQTAPRKSARIEGISFPNTFKDRKEMKEPLKVLQELCDYPVLYVNYRSIVNENSVAVSISNKNPEINQPDLTAVYPKDAVVVDLCHFNNPNQDYTNAIDYWVNMVCSILTFRGHEVFMNNNLYIPYEN